MAVGSGLGSSLGFIKESVYGTYVAPTKFIPVTGAAIDDAPTRVQGQGLRNGSFGPLASHYAETAKSATASITTDLHTKTLGQLFEALMGSSASAQQAATAAYLQTFTLADTLGKSLTVQTGNPYRTGTVRPHTLTGGKVTAAEFSCDSVGAATSTWTIDGQAFTDSQSLAAISYAADTQPPFHGGQLAVKLGTYGAESSKTGIRGYSLSIARPHDTADYTAGAAGLKAEPVQNGYTTISGSITADWLDKATFQDLARGTASTSLVIEHVGALIATTYYYTLRFTIPGVIFQPGAQSADGLGELTKSWAFDWAYDGTNQPKIEYITTDTAV